MNISEIERVTRFTEEAIRNMDLRSRYASLANKLRDFESRNTIQVSQRVLQEIKPDIDQLIRDHQQLKMPDWNQHEDRIFGVIGARSIVGSEAASEISLILRSSRFTAALGTFFENLLARVESLLNNLADTNQFLAPVFELDSKPEIPDGYCVIHAIYTKKETILGFAQLEDELGNWQNLYLRGPSSVLSKSPPELRIYSVSIGTIDIGFMLDLDTVVVLLKFLSLSIDIAKLVREREVQLKKLPEDLGPEFEVSDEELEKRIEKIVSEKVDESVKEILKSYKKSEEEGNKISSDLKASLNAMNKFLLKGGRVTLEGPPNELDETIAELKAASERIDQLENQLAKLTALPAKDESDGKEA